MRQVCCLEVFANPLRMKILRELQKGSKSVTELTEFIGVERSRVSHALMDLKKCFVVSAKKEGRTMLYSLNKDTPLTTKKTGNLIELIDHHIKCNCGGKCPKD